jgi:hypothetical protein
MELHRAAELYTQSQNQVKRLTQAVVLLVLIMVLLVGTIVGVTAHVKDVLVLSLQQNPAAKPCITADARLVAGDRAQQGD